MLIPPPHYRTHYKEYLVDLINKNKLDPISMYSTIKIELMLTREEMALPDDEDEDDDDVQRAKLIQVCVERGLVHDLLGGLGLL